jgi:signal transduction histidine kinase
MNARSLIMPSFVAALVLAIGLLYTLGNVYAVPYPGFVFDTHWRILDFQETCSATNNDQETLWWCHQTAGLLQLGDQIEAYTDPINGGGMTQEAYLVDWSVVPYQGLKGGEPVLLSVIRITGEKSEIEWTMRGGTLQGQLRRLSGSLLFLPFWLAGTIVLLFFRPCDRRWYLLVAFNYLTALWFIVGTVSVSHIYGSTSLLILLSWLLMPVYLHLHLLLPYPVIEGQQRWLIGAIYSGALLIALLSLFDIVPASSYSIALLIAMLGSILLLLVRLIRPAAAERPALYLMLTGILVAVLPGLLWFTSIVGGNNGAVDITVTMLVTLALPALPFFYTYALYKHGLGGMEVRANRALTIYGFAVLYATVFVILFVIFYRQPGFDAAALGAALAASSTCLLLAILAWNPVRRILNHLAYGTVYEPEQLIRHFANEIPRALNRTQLTQLLITQVTPSLLIRQSALFWFADSEDPLIYSSRIDETAAGVTLAQVLPLMSIRERFLTGKAVPAPPLDWVRLAIPIEVDQEPVGIWLLGRRDPDDFYPQSDIELLTTLGNQIAVALETSRLFEIVQQRTRELEKANFELRRADRLKGDLLRNVTHELRTPLTVIQGYTELLIEDDAMNPDQQEFLNAISSSTQSLVQLVNNVLTLQQQRLHHDNAAWQWVDVGQIASHCVRRAQILLGKQDLWLERAFQIELDAGNAPLSIWVDPIQLAQVFDNLLSNAVKFSPQGGSVCLRLWAGDYEFPNAQNNHSAMEGGENQRWPALFASVEDQGIGISQEEFDNIWLEFYQIDASTVRHFGGTGLGLTLVKDIVESYGGAIWLESQVGKGSCFTFALPILDSVERPKELSPALVTAM